jgi:LSD1 subclass zinc finger protein
MKVRCGSCRTQFEVPGAGRYACPVCGSVNAVRDANGAPAADGPSVGGYQAGPGVGPAGDPAGGQPPPPPQPPQPDLPMPKIACPECGFTFIVGMIASATCPNCSAEVETGIEEELTAE